MENELAKTPGEKLKIGYEVKDDDDCLIFTPVMFREALHSFAKDNDLIYEVTVAQLCQRLAAFEISAVVPPHIRAKIEGIINYIEKNSTIYRGVGVVYRV